MKHTWMQRLSVSIVLITFLTGCSSTKQASYNGMPTAAGTAVAHLSTSNIAIHLLVGKKPLMGDASLNQTLADFTAAAKNLGATKVQVVQSSQTAWWYLFFPFTLLFTPVTSNVAGDALQ